MKLIFNKCNTDDFEAYYFLRCDEENFMDRA